MTPADQIRTLLVEAYNFAKKAHDYCFDDLNTGKPSNKNAVMANTYACVSKYSAAAAIYWDHPELQDEKFLRLIRQFEYVTEQEKAYKPSDTTNIVMALMDLEDMLEG